MTKKKEIAGAKQKIIVDDKFLDQVEKFADLGFSQKNMHQYFGVGHVTWYKMIKKYPQIKKRIKKGRMKGLNLAVLKLREKIEEGCVTSIKFFLQTKHKWKVENDIKLKTDKKEPLELKITTTDPVEAGRIYEQIMTPTGS